jgi:hypothetical protein
MNHKLGLGEVLVRSGAGVVLVDSKVAVVDPWMAGVGLGVDYMQHNTLLDTRFRIVHPHIPDLVSSGEVYRS